MALAINMQGLQYVKPEKGGNKQKEVFVRKSEIHFDLRPIGKNILKRCHPYLQTSPKFGFMESIEIKILYSIP